MKSIMDMRKEYEQSEFLKFSPLERMKIMHQLLVEIFAIKAKAEGVTEYEIYRRYLKNNPRHYQKVSGELAKKIGRDKKLEMLLSHPPEEPGEEAPDELI